MPKHSKKLTIVTYLIILALVVAIVYSLQRQTGSSVEDKVIEAGLIESGSQPALYFNLRNTGEKFANFTYIVTYNVTNTDMKRDTASVTIAPRGTFAYSISLTRPTGGITVLNLKIYRGAESANEDVLLHNQTWTIKAQP